MDKDKQIEMLAAALNSKLADVNAPVIIFRDTGVQFAMDFIRTMRRSGIKLEKHAIVIALSGSQEIETLSDSDLKRAGLHRIGDEAPPKEESPELLTPVEFAVLGILVGAALHYVFATLGAMYS